MKAGLRRVIHLLVICMPTPFEQILRTLLLKDEALIKNYSSGTFLFVTLTVLGKTHLNRPL